MPHCRYLDQNIYIFCVRRQIFQLCGSNFPFLARSHSLTCLTSQGSALRSKKRLMGELISSGFYTCNRSWLQTLSGSQMKRQIRLHVCESVSVCMCVYICIDVTTHVC